MSYFYAVASTILCMSLTTEIVSHAFSDLEYRDHSTSSPRELVQFLAASKLYSSILLYFMYVCKMSVQSCTQGVQLYHSLPY